MDANGTRYHLLLGEADWSACGELRDVPGAVPRLLGEHASPLDPRPAAYFDRTTNELTLTPRVELIPPTPGEKRYTPPDRRGAAVDRFGNWYWIAESRTEILVYSEGSRDTTHFWASDDDPPCRPPHPGGAFAAIGPAPTRPPRLVLSGLAVTALHYLVVGTLDPAGLLVFDLHGGGPPRHLLWPAGRGFTPFDMAADPRGGLWILDRVAEQSLPVSARLWELDERFRVRTLLCSPLASPLETDAGSAFGPVTPPQDPAPPCHTPGVTDVEPAHLLAAADPVAVEVLSDGTVLILDRAADQGFATIWQFARGETAGRELSTRSLLEILDRSAGDIAPVAGHDLAAISRTAPDKPDTIYVVTPEGNQAFAFDLDVRNGEPVLTPRTEYLPLRRFGGKALVAAGGRVYYDFRDAWVPLVAQRRPRFETEAVVVTPLAAVFGERPAFDGREPGCVWHRLMIDARIPPEAEVRVWSRAADEPAELASTPWQPEPLPYRRGDGCELPFVGQMQPCGGTHELLFQRARGRFLQLKFRLAGNGRNTPRVRAVRAYYPRFSYLQRYLPAVYREDPDSASFLDRFLANPEGLATAIEDRVAAAQVLFDPRTAPAELLDWLAGWLALVLDPTWGEARRRLFLQNAAEFLRCRGTLRGVQMAARLAIDPDPDRSIFTDPFCCGHRPHPVRIVERFRTRNAPAVAAGDPTEGGLPAGSTPEGRWKPAQGADVLHARYRLAREAAGIPTPVDLRFPLTAPPDGTDLWRRFARSVLGLEPQSPITDPAEWAAFLARRYRDIDGLNRAWGTTYPALADVPLPGRPRADGSEEPLPPAGPALADWFAFEAITLAMRRTAHRFTVLIPTGGGTSAADDRTRLELARRVVALEKPAHTVFDVRFYYALFRVGEVRLGFDTVLGHGSRAADLLPPFVLDRNYLAEAVLAARHPQDVDNRSVVGRDRLPRSYPGACVS